jgi:mandelamide amidase
MVIRLVCSLLITSLIVSVASAQEQTSLRELSAREVAEQVRSGTLRSTDLVQALLAGAEQRKALNAIITLNPEARDRASALDALAHRGDFVGPLHGVPIVVKDNIAGAGLPTTAGTPALRDFRPRQDAPVLQRLLDAGAVLLAKTNMHELAFGITSNNAGFGAVGNPYAPDRFAGGSSGGTGAAIAARIVPAGLGTDTGGSVRIPAALNGIVGLRPSIGRYPQEGIVPISHTRDTAGPMARTVADLVLLDGVITGEPTTLAPAALEDLRLGLPKPFNDDLDPEVARVRDAAIERLKTAGVDLIEIDLAEIAALNEKVGFPVALYEAKRDIPAYLTRYGAGVDLTRLAAQIASPDVRFVFDELILGKQAIPEEVYRTAMEDARPKLQKAYANAFAQHRIGALLFPATPLPAQTIQGSDREVTLNGRKVPTFQTFIRNTDPGSNAGIPGLVIPAGVTHEGLPVGLELDGPAGSDRDLLRIGLALEAAFGRVPPPSRR